MTKSIEIESQFQVGISKGLNSLMGHWYSTMAFLANKTFIHVFCNFSSHIVSQKYFLKYVYILVPPRCTK